MPNYIIEFMNGKTMQKKADHYEIDDDKGQIVFYKSKTEVDNEVMIFKHGVISIKLDKPLAGNPILFTGASREDD